MKTTIDLPDDLLIEVKIEAARQHKKLKALVAAKMGAKTGGWREPVAVVV